MPARRRRLDGLCACPSIPAASTTSTRRRAEPSKRAATPRRSPDAASAARERLVRAGVEREPALHGRAFAGCARDPRPPTGELGALDERRQTEVTRFGRRGRIGNEAPAVVADDETDPPV